MASQEPQLYDAIASDYDVIWKTPAVRILRSPLEEQLQNLGPWTGKSVLDLACGTGYGLRLMRSLGASKLVGVDISKEMLAVCESTSKDFGGLELYQADCSKPLAGLGLEEGSFDLVIGMWLLNYAPDSASVQGMWNNIATYLKPSGHFIGILQNQDVDLPTSMETLKYGAMESNIQLLDSGDGISMHVQFDTQPKVEFDACRLKPEIVEAAAEKAGMGRLRYVRAGPEHLTEDERKDLGWWQELLDEYPNQVVVATKGQ